MRILVVSDTHGDEGAFWRALDAQPGARLVIHLGDGAREAADMAARYPEKTFWSVRGNCDFSAGGEVPLVRDEMAEGKRLFLTHGHLYDAKMGLYRLCCAARERKADLLLFGHTHQALTEYDSGLYILNPGSLHGGGSYGVVDITSAGIAMHIAEDRR